jgi:hypothetical protein
MAGYVVEGLTPQVAALRSAGAVNPWHWLPDTDPLRHGLTWHAWIPPLASFLGSRLSMREQAAAMWFGPKGFASVVYGLLVLSSGITAAEAIVGLVVAARRPTRRLNTEPVLTR